MNMAVEYQRGRDARRSHEEENARRSVRMSAATKAQPRHVAVTAKGMMAMVIAFSMLFCVLVGLVYIKYLVVETQLEINSINAQIHEANNEQTRLEERLDRAGSVQVIMERAAELGMAQPATNQILYVHFPEEAIGESMALDNGN